MEFNWQALAKVIAVTAHKFGRNGLTHPLIGPQATLFANEIVENLNRWFDDRSFFLQRCKSVPGATLQIVEQWRVR